MPNDLSFPGKPSFDYSLVTQDQAVQLRDISVRLSVRVQRTAEEMLAMGADMREAKRICKEDGTLFTAWCESSECPVSYKTAQKMIAVTEQLGGKKEPQFLFEQGFNVIAAVTQTRDEDIRQALIEHLKESAENGEAVTQKEITALKKALNDAQAKAKKLEDQSFDARQAMERIKIERDKAIEREKEAREKKDQFAQDLIDADKKRKDIEKEYQAKLKAKQEELKDAEEVHREHLAEMRKKIAEEERNRPRTDAEEAAHQDRLKALQEEAAKTQVSINQSAKAKADLEKELNDLRKEVALRDKVLNDWATASIGFREVALRLTGSAKGLKSIPLTDELYSQIKMIRELASEIVSTMDEVTHVG